MNSDLDPKAQQAKEGSTPSSSSTGNLTHKRPASSPLNKQTRSVRQNTNQETPILTDPDVTEENTANNDAANNADDNTIQSAIHNQFFPKFKLLRKLNNKLITARHHKTFLLNLKERGQVPKGLQIKSAPTGAELDLILYHEWEEAHITLSNRLRDILIQHWTNTEDNLTIVISDTTNKLTSEAPTDQSELILQLIEKANESKAQELTTRRRRKENARKTGTSAGGGNPQPPQPPTQ